MNKLCEQLIDNDLNPYILFDTDGKILNYNKEAESLMTLQLEKELFNLALNNASLEYGFNKKYINLIYNKHNFYAILVGYLNEKEIILRLYKAVIPSIETIHSNNLQLMNIFNLIDISQNASLLHSKLIVQKKYDVSIPDININLDHFLYFFNHCFKLFSKEETITLKVNTKIGRRRIINKKKYQVVAIDFLLKTPIGNIDDLDQKAKKINGLLFIEQYKISLELPIL